MPTLVQTNFYTLTFTDFNFDSDLFEGLNSMGYKTPTPIQAETIPLIQQQHDLIACAQTGTGKTASYLLPVMDAICRLDERPLISALILAPTRELAMQIDQQVEGLAYFTGLTSIAIYTCDWVDLCSCRVAGIQASGLVSRGSVASNPHHVP